MGRTLIVLALAAAGIGALWLLWIPQPPAPAPAVSVTPPLAKAPSIAPGPTPTGPPRPPAPAPEGDADPTRDLSGYVARGENPSMSEVISRLHERGIHSGLGAFLPPGTSPPLVGLAVPEQFALPRGYVRHHQATDDGQRIDAILMFAPDFQLYDANGVPIAMPKDRVVTPELAPPGLPIRRIAIPASREPGTPGA